MGNLVGYSKLLWFTLVPKELKTRFRSPLLSGTSNICSYWDQVALIGLVLAELLHQVKP